MSQQSPVFMHPDDDPEMEQASKHARQTFRFFWREMAAERERIIPGLDLACIKVAFSDPPGNAMPKEAPSVEQMWVSEVDFDGQTVRGTLLNSPNWLTSISEGDPVEIPPARVNDWMYSISNRVYGAFTVNLLRARMSAKERSEHDAAWGLDFGDPQQILLVPPEYLGQKPKGNGLVARLFGGSGAPPQDSAEVGEFEHPMSVNMAESLEASLRSNPSFITSGDEHGFTLLHQLALAGSADGVAILLRHGADRNAKSKNGKTPFQLAKSLGWKKVMAILEG